MHRIRYKPLSVNQAYTGQRHKTPIYKVFVHAVKTLLTVKKPPKPDPDKPMFAHYVWGVSNFQADVDNPCKVFQDTLFDFWNIKNKDHRVEFIILQKLKAKKGKEFIGFDVGNRDDLIAHLEALLEHLKGESK